MWNLLWSEKSVEGQIGDAKIQEIRDLITKGRGPEFTEDEQGIVWFKDRICVPDIESLRETILKEAHDLDYSISSWEYQDVSGFGAEVLVV
jgi:hypothetical protein